MDAWTLPLACGQSETFNLSTFTSDTLAANELATGDNEMLSRFIGCAKLRPQHSVLKVNVKNLVFSFYVFIHVGRSCLNEGIWAFKYKCFF